MRSNNNSKDNNDGKFANLGKNRIKGDKLSMDITASSKNILNYDNIFDQMIINTSSNNCSYNQLHKPKQYKNKYLRIYLLN